MSANQNRKKDDKLGAIVVETLTYLGMAQHTDRFLKLLNRANITSMTQIETMSLEAANEMHLPWDLVTAVQKRIRVWKLEMNDPAEMQLEMGEMFYSKKTANTGSTTPGASTPPLQPSGMATPPMRPRSPSQTSVAQPPATAKSPSGASTPVTMPRSPSQSSIQPNGIMTPRQPMGQPTGPSRPTSAAPMGQPQSAVPSRPSSATVPPPTQAEKPQWSGFQGLNRTMPTNDNSRRPSLASTTAPTTQPDGERSPRSVGPPPTGTMPGGTPWTAGAPAMGTAASPWNPGTPPMMGTALSRAPSMTMSATGPAGTQSMPAQPTQPMTGSPAPPASSMPSQPTSYLSGMRTPPPEMNGSASVSGGAGDAALERRVQQLETMLQQAMRKIEESNALSRNLQSKLDGLHETQVRNHVEVQGSLQKMESLISKASDGDSSRSQLASQSQLERNLSRQMDQLLDQVSTRIERAMHGMNRAPVEDVDAIKSRVNGFTNGSYTNGSYANGNTNGAYTSERNSMNKDKDKDKDKDSGAVKMPLLGEAAQTTSLTGPRSRPSSALLANGTAGTSYTRPSDRTGTTATWDQGTTSGHTPSFSAGFSASPAETAAAVGGATPPRLGYSAYR